MAAPDDLHAAARAHAEETGSVSGANHANTVADFRAGADWCASVLLRPGRSAPLPIKVGPSKRTGAPEEGMRPLASYATGNVPGEDPHAVVSVDGFPTFDCEGNAFHAKLIHCAITMGGTDDGIAYLRESVLEAEALPWKKLVQHRNEQLDQAEQDLEKARALPGELARPMTVLQRLFGSDLEGGDAIHVDAEEPSGRVPFFVQNAVGETKRAGVTAATLASTEERTVPVGDTTHERIEELLAEMERDGETAQAVKEAVVPWIEQCRTFVGELAEHKRREDEYWKMLCDASDALGGPTPEKAPHVASWIRKLKADLADAQERLTELEKQPYCECDACMAEREAEGDES